VLELDRLASCPRKSGVYSACGFEIIIKLKTAFLEKEISL